MRGRLITPLPALRKPGSAGSSEGWGVTTANFSDALEAFILEHEYCGDLDAGVEDDRVWMTCTCGAVIVRALEPAARD